MGYQRKVKEEVTITCDRCGKSIVNSDSLVHIGYFRVFKWCLPNGWQWKRTYLCKNCWDGLNEYLKSANNERTGEQNG